MPLNTAVKSEVSKKLETYEGRISHLYLDTIGKVTVGIGNMIPNKAAMNSFSMYKVSANKQFIIASLADKEAEFDVIKKLPFGRNYSASSFKKHSSLIIKDVDIDIQREKHIQSFYKELLRYYSVANGFNKSFDNMPIEAQLALFDMVFNLGITKLKNQYVKFNSLIKQEKWAEAAKQSNRVGISPIRNQYVMKLLKLAQQKITKVP
ncbi:hypothetical protein J8L86_18110 [Shewanella sp. MMG014]|uniref:hypothetical protein n=1 Tax=Shewanella sp. MMG014 TaxID=2822691 RepID=UPI001B395009|nr:hypothetical protein [Shewanella sp. MMG014]MBQ4891764.1 hypothetical protein [Shewanella sp. MMG014]